MKDSGWAVLRFFTAEDWQGNRVDLGQKHGVLPNSTVFCLAKVLYPIFD